MYDDGVKEDDSKGVSGKTSRGDELYVTGERERTGRSTCEMSRGEVERIMEVRDVFVVEPLEESEMLDCSEVVEEVVRTRRMRENGIVIVS